MNITLSTDENYILPTGIAISSILDSNPLEEIHFYIITKLLSDFHISKLKSFIKNHTNHAKIDIIKLNDDLFSDFPVRSGDHVSVAAYYRIFLPRILPDSIERILYLDGDIFCTDSIKLFYDTDLQNYSCAVCHDERNDEDSNFIRLKYPKQNGYFNSGVMLINLDWWRKNNITEKCLDYIAKEPDACLWHDQDALNHVLDGTVFWADFRYNFTQGFFFDKKDMCIDEHFYSEIDTAKKNPCIIHFSSAYKPWHIECNHPLKMQYRNFYKQYTGQKLHLLYKQTGLARIKWFLKRILNNLHIRKYADFRKPI